ncbi:hypothetical protein HYS94_04665, partial [Candidatus Daviesbacteria bacterium]|nr:hypothetical protein [Candidatus Daviesbacteria bacterium]
MTLLLLFPYSVRAHSLEDATIIHLEDGRFEPAEVTIKQNEIVTFENVG